MNMMIRLLSLFPERNLNVSNRLMKTFGVFGTFSYSFFYFMESYFNKDHEFFILRFSCFLICLSLAFIDYWPSFLKAYKKVCWYLSIFYCLSFFTTYMFIENFGSEMWFTKATVGILWLVLITDWLTFLIITAFGIATGCFAHYMINGFTSIDMAILARLSINYIMAILVATIFSRSKENIQQERLNAMRALASTVAHEMRTPFFGIRSNIGCIQKFLPTVLEGYQKATQAKLVTKPLSERNMHHLIEAPEDLDKITISASMVIDMLLMSLKDDSYKNKHYEICSMKECIEDTFHEYPLNDEEKSLITWNHDLDFTYYGNTLLMKHVLFNLLKNALYYVKAANKEGTISLWTEPTSKGNILYFKDTGQGMSPQVADHIFDQFYSHTRHGSGIGLAFCKSVIDGFGGTIACESIEGEYTLFILKFPVVKETVDKTLRK